MTGDKRQYSSKFPHKSVVWAKMEGYPWWPGIVVTRPAVRLYDDEEEPILGPTRVLVEFFNDNKRFASMKEGMVEPFKCKDYENHKAYSGTHSHELCIAVDEAEEYYGGQQKKLAAKAGKGNSPLPSSLASPTADNALVPDPTEAPQTPKRDSPVDSPLRSPTLSIKRMAPRKPTKKRRKKDSTAMQNEGDLDAVEKPKKRKKHDKTSELGRDTKGDELLGVLPEEVKKPLKRKRKERDTERQPPEVVDVPKSKIAKKDLITEGRTPGEYSSLSKQDIIRLLHKRDDDLRAMRVEVWRHRLKDMDKRDIINTAEALLERYSTAFGKVNTFIDLAKESHRSDSDEIPTQLKISEQSAAQAITDVKNVNFDIALLKTTKLGTRLFKLTKTCGSLSTVLWNGLRELLVQWVDVLSIAPCLTKDNEDSVGKGKESADGIAGSAVEADEPRNPVPSQDTADESVAGRNIRSMAKLVQDDKTMGEAEPPKVTESERPRSEGLNERQESSKELDKAKSSSSRFKLETPKDSEKPRGSSRSKALTPDVFLEVGALQIRDVLEVLPDTTINDSQLKKIVQGWEKAIVPAWKDDPEGYYSASLKLMKCVKRATKFYQEEGGQSPDPTVRALASCLQRPEESAGLVKLCLSGVKPA